MYRLRVFNGLLQLYLQRFINWLTLPKRPFYAWRRLSYEQVPGGLRGKRLQRALCWNATVA